jgi:hypothetical protein
MSILKNPLLFVGSQSKMHYYPVCDCNGYLNNIYPNVVGNLEKLIKLDFEQKSVFVDSKVAKM